MDTTHSQQQMEFDSVYDRRRRASLYDARLEAQAVSNAIKRISDDVDEQCGFAHQNRAAGKLFEIANELPSAEVAYRRSLAADSQLHEATARLVIVLIKLSLFEEAVQLGNDLFLQIPGAVFESLVCEGPLSLRTVLWDVYRLKGEYAEAASFYREAAKLEGGTPHAVSQAVAAMALSDETIDIPEFTAQHASVQLSERISSVPRLASQTDTRLAIGKQAAARANVLAAESMSVSPFDLVVRPLTS